MQIDQFSACKPFLLAGCCKIGNLLVVRKSTAALTSHNNNKNNKKLTGADDTRDSRSNGGDGVTGSPRGPSPYISMYK